MNNSSGPKVIFVAKNKEWYADLVNKMKEKYVVDYFSIPYLFEQQHSSKLNVVIDSVFLFLYFPIAYLIKGRGLYILSTRHLPFLFWFRILTSLGVKQKVVAMNFYFHGMREKKMVKKILSFLLKNKNLTVIAPSKNDYNYFRYLSPGLKLHYVIYGLEKSAADFDVRDGGYIFCGGYNNRDFDIVLDVAKDVSVKFVIITSGREIFTSQPPSNIELLRDVDSSIFDNYLAGAKIVLIPLKDDVGAAGQIVTLTSMLFGKPIIFTDYDVVSEYFDDDVTGLAYRAGDRQDLKTKIVRLLDDSVLRKRLGEKAKESCEGRFTSSATNRSIVDIVSQLAT